MFVISGKTNYVQYLSLWVFKYFELPLYANIFSRNMVWCEAKSPPNYNYTLSYTPIPTDLLTFKFTHTYFYVFNEAITNFNSLLEMNKKNYNIITKKQCRLFKIIRFRCYDLCYSGWLGMTGMAWLGKAHQKARFSCPCRKFSGHSQLWVRGTLKS